MIGEVWEYVEGLSDDLSHGNRLEAVEGAVTRMEDEAAAMVAAVEKPNVGCPLSTASRRHGIPNVFCTSVSSISMRNCLNFCGISYRILDKIL